LELDGDGVGDGAGVGVGDAAGSPLLQNTIG